MLSQHGHLMRSNCDRDSSGPRGTSHHTKCKHIDGRKIRCTAPTMVRPKYLPLCKLGFETGTAICFNFCGDKSPIVEPLVFTVSDFGWLWLWVFKARVDSQSPVLCFHLHIMILIVNDEFLHLGQVLVLHLGMVLEWPLNVISGMAGKFESMTLWPKSLT